MYCNKPTRLPRSNLNPRNISISYTSFHPRQIGIMTHTYCTHSVFPPHLFLNPLQSPPCPVNNPFHLCCSLLDNFLHLHSRLLQVIRPYLPPQLNCPQNFLLGSSRMLYRLTCIVPSFRSSVQGLLSRFLCGWGNRYREL